MEYLKNPAEEDDEERDEEYEQSVRFNFTLNLVLG
jgi:hypothetical protein